MRVVIAEDEALLREGLARLLTDSGIEVVGRVDEGRDEWAPADAAIDFSTADALLANFPRFLQLRVPLVIGTTGWNQHAARLRAEAASAGLGVVAAANFSIGVNVFQLVAAEAARLMREQDQYGAWIHEAHHATKRDAPSGTALLLRDALALLQPQAPFVQFTYAVVPPIPKLAGVKVEASERIWLNLPPARVWVYRHG